MRYLTVIGTTNKVERGKKNQCLFPYSFGAIRGTSIVRFDLLKAPIGKSDYLSVTRAFVDQNGCAKAVTIAWIYSSADRLRPHAYL